MLFKLFYNDKEMEAIRAETEVCIGLCKTVVTGHFGWCFAPHPKTREIQGALKWKSVIQYAKHHIYFEKALLWEAVNHEAMSLLVF